LRFQAVLRYKYKKLGISRCEWGVRDEKIAQTRQSGTKEQKKAEEGTIACIVEAT
jgi:hypothetical protein